MSKLKVYKYLLLISDNRTIHMPVDAKILCVQVQQGIPCIWALVNPEQDTRPFEFISVGTGNPTTLNGNEKHIGTYQLEEGSLVFHVFLNT